MLKLAALIYGLVSYAIFLAAFLYAIGFVGNLALELGGTQLFPRTVDNGVGAVSGFDWPAFLINAGLLGAFAIQHSVMARPWFKRAWTKIVHRSIERSTYVLLASLLLMLLYWQWVPMTDGIWSASAPWLRTALWCIFALGWLLVLLSTFAINHWDLFGLRQVYLNFQAREPAPLEFKVHGLYALCRHPIMLGFLIAFWSTPDMSLGHLVFSIATSAYVLLALQFEEGDLHRAHPEYASYRKSTSMLLPLGRKR